jgi:hypothetical protein
VRIVDSEIARSATELARSVSPAYLFNHAMRTYLFGVLIGRAAELKFDEEILYLACVLHDLGLTKSFEGDLPFEIQGAQAAKSFLRKQGFDDGKAELVWDGIAMHASIIGQYKGPEVSLVGDGAGADVVGPDSSKIHSSTVEQVVTAYPRLGFKSEFLKGCAEIVRRHPRGASRSFMRDIGQRYVDQYSPTNFCDLVLKAPFAE